jgi:hypothetical protein
MDLVCEVCSLAGTQLHTKLSMALADVVVSGSLFQSVVILGKKENL